MSWDSTYSFGTPSAQPPTPTKTPTSAAFPSPAFQTPRNNSSSFENRSGWTPTFAEEYSVFNATPGRLTAQNPFVETPRPIERQLLGSAGDISKGFATHDSNLSPVLPHSVNSSNQLLSTGAESSSRSRFDDTSKRQVTPQKPKKRLEEAFSGQTATPPNTVSKGSRRLAPKLSNTMDHDSQNGQYDPLGTPSQQSFMPFPTTSTDLFGQPMSAPATTPVFNSNSFWDPDTSMGGMDMDFTPESAVFNTNLNTTSHRPANSFDWGRTNQLFQDTVNMPQPQPQPRAQEPAPQPVKRQRALAPKVSAPPPATQPTSLPPFDFGRSSASEDPFAVTNMGGIVNPGLLFSRHSNSNSISESNLDSGFEDVMMPPTRPATSQLVLEPYAHQRRESRRDQEELRRARSMRENGSFRFDKGRGILSSPVKGSARPALHRSVSDSKGKRVQGKRQLPPATKVTGSENRAHPRGGRVSPVKQALNNLHSIPESPDRRARTEVKFTIDSNGRARTETVVIVDEPQTRPARRESSLVHGDDWNSSSYESSSDDEPIIIPSQNNSFALPGQRGPKHPRFETSYGIPDGRRSSASGSSYNQSDSSRYSGRYDGHDSEAETVMDDEDGDGNATRELRKMMESRKQSPTKALRDPRHHHFLDTSRSGMQYGNYGSSTTSPTEGATPSSSRSGTTRCVCNKPDGDGFMIQCESCDNWLHGPCVGIDHRSLPPVYICAFCANTPNNIRGIRKSIPTRGSNVAPLASPLAHKSFKSFR